MRNKFIETLKEKLNNKETIILTETSPIPGSTEKNISVEGIVSNIQILGAVEFKVTLTDGSICIINEEVCDSEHMCFDFILEGNENFDKYLAEIQK